MEKQYDMEKRIRSFIEKEKEMQPNPYLHTRVMASIAAVKKEERAWYQPVLKPMLALASLALVIWLGVAAGNAWPGDSDGEPYLENDSRTENLSFYTQTENDQP